MDAALRPGQDEPDAVKMVAVVLRVVRRQDDPRGAGEVEEAGNCKGRAVRVRGTSHSLQEPLRTSPGRTIFIFAERERMNDNQGWAGLAGCKVVAGRHAGFHAGYSNEVSLWQKASMASLSCFNMPTLGRFAALLSLVPCGREETIIQTDLKRHKLTLLNLVYGSKGHDLMIQG